MRDTLLVNSIRPSNVFLTGTGMLVHCSSRMSPSNNSKSASMLSCISSLDWASGIDIWVSLPSPSPSPSPSSLTFSVMTADCLKEVLPMKLSMRPTKLSLDEVFMFMARKSMSLTSSFEELSLRKVSEVGFFRPIELLCFDTLLMVESLRATCLG